MQVERYKEMTKDEAIETYLGVELGTNVKIHYK